MSTTASESSATDNISATTYNKRVVIAFMAAQTDGDFVEQRRLLQDEVTFHVPNSGEKILNIPVLTKGAEEYIETRRAAVGKLYKSHARSVEMKCLISEGDFVVAFYHMTTELVDGGPYENTCVFIYRLEDGTIAEIWENVDTAYAYLQFGFRVAKG